MVGKLTPNNIVSASRVAQLLGLSPYATQNELLAEMINIDEGKLPEPWDGNELTRWGDIHEPAIIKEAAHRLGLVDVVDNFDEPFHHPELPLASSLDGRGTGTGEVSTDAAQGIFVDGDTLDLTGRRVIIECKTTQAMPEDVLPPWRGPLQNQVQMECADAQYGVVAVLYRGSTLRLWVYQRDERQLEAIHDALTDFEARRAVGDWYPVVNSDDGNVAFSQVDQAAPPLDVEDAEVQQAIEDLIEAKARKKECDQVIDASQAIIKDYMGNHEQAITEYDGKRYMIKWGMRNIKATPEKITPAKPASQVRSNTLTLKELGDA